MYSIKDSITNTIIIKKSKFICKLFRINSLENIEAILDSVNNEYNDSTHVCYAYIINGHEKANDNGEPSGTAGLPILNVLKKNNLENILAVVIRYFGGIKLGAGGLIRAYSNSVTEALKLINVIELTEGYLIELEFTYEQMKLIDYMLKDKKIINKYYNDNIIYTFYLTKEELNLIPEFEKVSTKVSIKEKTLITND